ncbi:thioredoxin family protein [Dissulfurirhabdus thermomarina]|uniref:Thioredoxin family protein n=1 Tax=Dissulfurirhabdus thermomarina TaxID=1765737 RepID=A0A6N9TTG9_DISTH|nr:thioredoxin family protein [Dissulfurirhabdus thermomarina]NDY43393.1 thioredoxin family protein [Dissulfurirhabdus thermomarina]NMX23249.1 thioredoxin family protein [Dissulfurirhabdus thermomarina]
MSARTIRIGRANVGLIGLERAMAEVAAEAGPGGLPPREAARRLLDRLTARNYVPDTAREEYLAALADLWRREHGEPAPEPASALTIRILGKDCVSCNRLEEMVRLVLDRWGVAADLDHVRDLDEIWRYGVFKTPALVVDGKVVCAGRLPPQAEVEGWLREAVAAARGGPAST